jgi:putative toxin-antitoxin system antitoxin component (TIGR02293 family)
MAAKKGGSTTGKLFQEEAITYVPAARGSRAARTPANVQPDRQSTRTDKNFEPATRRAIELLRPYEATFRSPTAKLSAIKKGLDAHAITALIEITGATQMDLAQILDLTEPTLRKHIRVGKELNTGLSEHILQLFQLFDKGMDTFGSLEEFKSWLRHESIVLSARPLEVLDTITGINMVMDELVRIDYGITV